MVSIFDCLLYFFHFFFPSNQRNNARVIADSILNLKKERLIDSPENDAHVTSELRNQGVSVDPPHDDDDPTNGSAGGCGLGQCVLIKLGLIKV